MTIKNLLKTSTFIALSLGLFISDYMNPAFANIDPDIIHSDAVDADEDASQSEDRVLTDAEIELSSDGEYLGEARYYETYQEAKNGKAGKRKRKKPSDWPKAKACNKIYDEVKAALGGSKSKADCYMGLFFMETTCNPNLSQGAGNAGNAHAAYGLCSLEKSSKVRRDNNRGPNCDSISGVANQTKCCRAILMKTPKYFGPYNRGEVPQCG